MKSISLRLAILSILLQAISVTTHAQISGPSIVCEGSTITLSDTGSGTWSSGSPGVATVGSSSGMVTGMAPGAALITFTTGSGAYSTTITVNALPVAYSVTGGGTICAGSLGLHIGLSFSSSSASYQLWNGGTPASGPVTGTGAALDFGLQATGGTYTVVATATSSSCTAAMTGTAIISVNPTPSISGLSALCTGGTASLTPSIAGGAWTSSNTAAATIGSATGTLNGAGTGSTNITYTLLTGCFATSTITVTTAPCPLVAGPVICAGTTTTLTDCIAGGIWTSGTTSVATIGSSSGTVTAAASGSSTISYSLGTGCTVTTTLSVITSPAGITGPASTCVGSTISLSDGTPGGAWTSSAPGTGSVSGTGVVTGVAAGIATISYTSGACIVTLLVTINATPSAIGGSTTVCQGDSIALTDGIAGGSWSVTSTAIATVNASTGVLTGIAPGTTTVTYSIGGCLATKLVTVNAVAPITGTDGVCIASTTTLSNTVTGGTWSSGSTSVASVGPSSGIVAGITAGTSAITYTTAAGCAVNTVVTVAANPGPVTGVSEMCVGSCFTFTAGISGGVWSVTPVGLASIGSLSGTVCGIAVGSAVVSYTLGGACVATTTITVNATPFAISGTTNACEGQTTTLSDVSPGGAWSSSNPSVATIGSTGILSGVSTGTTIIFYTASHCTVIHSVNVNPLYPITGLSTVCAGQNVALADSGLGGIWTSSNIAAGAVVPSTGLVTGVSAGTTTVSYSMPSGCTTTIVVTVEAVPSPIIGVREVCDGNSIALSDTTSSGSWSSSDPTTAIVDPVGFVTGMAAGVATISYIGTDGCAATSSETVNPLPTAIGGPSTLCVGGTISLTDAGGGSWITSLPSVATIGSASGIVSGISTGATNISYILPTGCLISNAISVIAAPASILGRTTICAGDTATLSNTAIGGVWSSSNTSVATIDPTTGLVNAVAHGTAIINYVLGAGCSASVIVTVNPLPSLISGSTLVCQGSSISLTDPTPGGAWSAGTPAIAVVSPAGHVTGVSAGLAVISYTIASGCSITTSVLVDASPAPLSGMPVTCPGSATTLSSGVTGGTWTSLNTAVATVGTSGVVIGYSVGTTTISYLAPTGCAASVVVTISPVPAAMTGSSSVCEGSSIFLVDTVSGGTWSSLSTTTATINPVSGLLTGIAAGPTIVEYVTGAGCSVAALVRVNALPAPILGPGSLCSGSSISLTDGSPGGSWSSGSPAVATVGSTGALIGVSAGTVMVSYTAGCSATRTITVNATPSAIAGSLNTCVGGTVMLTDSVGPGTWSGSDPAIAAIGSTTGIVTGMAIGSAPISYTLPSGCAAGGMMHVYAPPSSFGITGGGSYCAGGSGVSIGLDSSAVGVVYYLCRGTTATGSFTGTDSALNFGLEPVAGSYSAVGTSTLTGCSVTMIGGATVSITSVVVPSVTVSATPGDTVCAGTAVNFTPAFVHGGLTPAYQWLVNGIGVSASSSYSYIPVNGDVVSIVLASSAACAVPDTVGDSLVMTVNTSAIPTIGIHAIPGDTVCRSTIVTMTSAITYGGTTPVYSWVKNGVYMGGAALYSFIPNDSDVVYCVLQSNYTCRTSGNDTSNSIVERVDTPVVPGIVITASPSALISLGEAVIFTATVTNGGTTPLFQWSINGVAIAGATNAIFVVDTFTNPQSDSVSCIVVSGDYCHVTSAQSQKLTVAPAAVAVVAGQVRELSIAPNPTTGDFILSGKLNFNADDEVTFEIIDMVGRKLYSSDFHAQNGVIRQSIHLPSEIVAGVYLAHVFGGNTEQTIRLVVAQ